MRCKHERHVDEWSAQGSDAPLEEWLAAHVEECAVCKGRVDDVRAVRAATETALPNHVLSEEARSTMRDALLVAAHASQQGEERSDAFGGGPSVGRYRWAMVAAVLLALSGAAVVGWRSLTEETVAGQWVAERGADVERLSAGVDEIIALRRGAAWFSVSPIPEGSRFRVVAGDGEVEVRGTRFRCDVRDGRLRSVRVEEGHVLVRVLGTLVAELRAGERWERTEEGPASPLGAMMEDGEDVQARADAEFMERYDPERSEPSPSAEEPVPGPSTGVVGRVGDRSAGVSTNPSTRMSSRRPPASARSPLEGRASALDIEETSERGPERVVQAVNEAVLDQRFADAWQLFRAGRALEAARAIDDILTAPGLDRGRRGEMLYWAAKAYEAAGVPARARSRASQSLRVDPDGWWSEEARRLSALGRLAPQSDGMEQRTQD